LKFHPCKIKGAFIIELDRIGDERGFFARAYCQKEFAAQGLHPTMVQANNSVSVQAGTLRGLHYQLGEHAEDKMIRCIHGEIFDALVDLRQDSPTFLQYETFTLNRENKLAIYVPRGCANGVMMTKPDTELFYLASNFYNKEAERGLRWNDPKIGIKWPGVPDVISEKDATHPDFDPAFHLDPKYGAFPPVPR
jgi:dTDP-4-dehydrorhamnose 3,5-epimerase